MALEVPDTLFAVGLGRAAVVEVVGDMCVAAPAERVVVAMAGIVVLPVPAASLALQDASVSAFCTGVPAAFLCHVGPLHWRRTPELAAPPEHSKWFGSCCEQSGLWAVGGYRLFT